MACQYYFEVGWVKVGDEVLWCTNGQTQYDLYDPVSGKPTGHMVRFVQRGLNQAEAVPCSMRIKDGGIVA